jgi:hypothetical protein
MRGSFEFSATGGGERRAIASTCVRKIQEVTPPEIIAKIACPRGELPWIPSFQSAFDMVYSLHGLEVENKFTTRTGLTLIVSPELRDRHRIGGTVNRRRVTEIRSDDRR